MADYTLSAEVTADVSGFTSGMVKASSSMEEFQGKCRGASESAKSDMGSAAGAAGSAWGGVRKRAAAAMEGLKSSVRGAASSLDGRLGGALSRVASVASGALGRIGSAASGPLSAVRSALGSMASRAQGAFSALSGAAAAAFSALPALAVAGIGSAVAAVSGAALSAYADYEQLAGGVKTIFGDAASIVEANANAAFASMGVSANGYMQQVTSFSASLKQSLGGDVVAAAERANTAMADMADNASIFGTNMADVQNAYQGFAKQNYTMLDNLKLGYGGTKEEMERLIDDANAWGAANGGASDLSIDSFADVVTAIHQVQESQGLADNAAHEAARTISGSVGMAKAAWENWVAGLGKDGADVEGLTRDLVSSVGSVVENVVPRIAHIGGSIVRLLPGAVAQAAEWMASNAPAVLGEAISSAWDAAVSGISGGLGIDLPVPDASQVASSIQGVADYVADTFAPAMEALGRGLSDFVGGLGERMAPALEAAQGVLRQVGDAIDGSVVPAMQAAQPVLEVMASALAGAVGPALSAVADIASTVFAAAFTVAGSVVSGAMQAISGVIQTVCGVIQVVVGALVGVFTGDWSMMASGASSVMNGLSGILAGIMNAISGTIGGVLNGIAGVFSSVWNGVADTVSGALSAVADTVGSVMGDSKNVISGALSAISGLFSGAKFEFPHIAMPHFSITGEFSLNPPSVPSLGIEWYAKGAILTRPTIFGARGSSLMGGGEAGPEAVLPIGRLVGFIADALDDLGYGERATGVTQNITQNVYEREDAYVAGTVLSRAALSAALEV